MTIENINAITRPYAAIFFIQNTAMGWVLFAVTFINLNIGLSGLLAAVVALGITKAFQFASQKSGIHVFNSALVGMSLGAFYQLNFYVIFIIILGAALTVFLTVALIDGLWRMDRLPVLSLPFIVVAAITALVAQQYSVLNSYAAVSSGAMTLILPQVDDFFRVLGSTFFTPHPVAGLVIFTSVLWYSRYMALLAVTGYLFGTIVFSLMTNNPEPNLLVWTGFNFVLTAIAVGGIYTIPGLAGFVTAMLAVSLSVLLVIAIKGLLFTYGLPVLALPFVVTTLLFLIAFRKRISVSPPWLAPEPGTPEINYERARLARVRNGEVNSVPILAPFFGVWEIYQGFNGPHTHKPPWQYALDFYITEDDKSYQYEGKKLKDFYCFGLPVLSPVSGEVIRTFDKFPDNAPGDVDVKNNWGNFVLLRLHNGLYVLVAHLREKSIKVKEGDYVTPGKVIAACGNSGRSPQPHIHLQVQRDPQLGSPTHPFHLASVMLNNEDSDNEYLVVCRPKIKDRIEPTEIGERLGSQLHLPVGRQLTYDLQVAGLEKPTRCKLQVEITLLGQFRLTSETGASAAFEENNGVLAFYDRQGPKDVFLDMFLLANGLTPLTESAHKWKDSPSANLLPLSRRQKATLSIFRPLGCGSNSVYHRRWVADNNVWEQNSTHQVNVGTSRYAAEIQSIIDPEQGYREISMVFENHRWKAVLVETGLAEDEGIPGWSDQHADRLDTIDTH